MSRIRSIKPEFWVSEQIANCSRDARLLFIGMWNFCDDGGIHPASYLKIKSEVFPADNISLTIIKNLITQLIKTGLIFEFTVENKIYWQVTGWQHQKISKPAFKYPKPCKNAGDSEKPAGFVRNPKLSAEIIQFPPADVDVDVELEHSFKRNIYNNNQDIITSGAELKNPRLSDEIGGPHKNLPEIYEEPVITIVLNDHSEFPISQNKIDEWQNLFQGIVVLNEIKKAKSWCINNPERRKTKRGILKFLNSWLMKAQDSNSNFGGRNYANRERRIESLAEKVERQQREDELEQSRQYF